MKKIYIGSDHAGFKLKEQITRWLNKMGVEYEDLGAHEFVPTDDYPDYAEAVARRVVRSKSFGILLCGSAQGVAIAANKVKGARAAISYSIKEARLSREHNDANILCLSGWHTHLHKATRMIERFLTTPSPSEPRHIRRVKKIKRIERS